MAAPSGSTYTPKSGPLAGRTFTAPPGAPKTAAYNQYQQARAKALGFSGYRQERQVRAQSALIYKQERAAGRFGAPGTLPVQERTKLTRILGDFLQPIMTGFRDPLTGKLDTRIGGSLDRYLQALGRRSGTETWPVGETP